MDRALVRGVSESFDRAIVREGGRAPEVALARRQHDLYCRRLEAAGHAVERLAPDDSYPDCVFVEDTAVVVGPVGVVTRPGAESRRGETFAVAEVLVSDLVLRTIEAPGTLDGGDVMILGDTVFVGRSSRSNDSGIEQLGDIVAEQGLRLQAVPVEGVLHLKSAVLPVDDETLVLTPGTVDEGLFAGLRIVHEDSRERHRFSALRMRSGTVLVTDVAPRTSARVETLGIEVEPIDVSEILAADGGLTCMSILYKV